MRENRNAARMARQQQAKSPAALHYSQVPGATDMAGYAPFYENITKAAMQRRASSAPLMVVEAGVRHGCSARIFLEALQDCDDWQLHLIDPVPRAEALALKCNTHVTFHQQEAHRVAPTFADASVDVLHLDVDYDDTHPYELTFQILLAFWHKLKPDADLIFHDCTDRFPGIKRLVSELEQSGWTMTYCDPARQCPIAAPAHARRDPNYSPAALDMTVVVPVVQDKFLDSLLSDISQNDIKPSEIIVIDNSGGQAKAVCDRFSNLPIRYLPQRSNIGVNAAWNLGVAEAKTELVSILNDDLVLPWDFFRSIQQTFAVFPRAGFIIPATIGPTLPGGRAPWIIGKPEDVNRTRADAPLPMPSVVSLEVRTGGWAMTVRKSLWTPIPESMFTFCGDDFIFRRIKDQGFWTLMARNNKLFHYVGISLDLKQRVKLNLPELARDQRAWRRIQAKNKRSS
jgi:GT2 family glycosyltransferase